MMKYVVWVYYSGPVVGKLCDFYGVWTHLFFPFVHSQPAFTCSKLRIETLEQDVKYAQS